MRTGLSMVPILSESLPCTEQGDTGSHVGYHGFTVHLKWHISGTPRANLIAGRRLNGSLYRHLLSMIPAVLLTGVEIYSLTRSRLAHQMRGSPLKKL